MKAPTLVVHEDSSGLTKEVFLPSGSKRVRWAVAPVAQGRMDGLGPTDTRLYVVVEIDTALWPVWEKALSPMKSQRPFRLPLSVADALLPPDVLASSNSDSTGRIIIGPLYDPKAIAASWYSDGVAVRTGKYVLMEFLSR